MGKNHRHKKQLKSERNKTKLKTDKTKFLPKGLNVTKTDFKIKQIVLPQQLRQHGSEELLSRRKLNIKDLLSRMRHHNATVRHDSCEELKQVLVFHIEEIAEQHLSQVLNGCAPLILDKEKKLRRDVIKIFDVLLEKVAVEKLSPFFSILSSYLRCAMTNIDRGIQEDSLLLLDILLKHLPQQVAADSDKILPNLFALISKLRNDSHTGRTLTMNLGSKITSVIWRVQVLSRLRTFLQAIMAGGQDKTKVNDTTEGIFQYANISSCIPIYNNLYARNALSLSLLDKQMEVEDEDIIMKNMNTLTGLLYENWLEVAPVRNFKQMDTDTTLLAPEPAMTLTSILTVLKLLLDYTNEQSIKDKTSFFTQNLDNFMKNILVLFPFTQQMRKKGNDTLKVLDVQGQDAKCVHENLLVAYFFCVAKRKLQENYVESAKKILQYIDTCFVNRNYVTASSTELLLSLVDVILFKNFQFWSKHGLNVDGILTKFILFYNNRNKIHSCKDQAFHMLCKVGQISHLSGNSAYQNWLRDLPSLLCGKEISMTTLNDLLIIGKQNNLAFLGALGKKVPEILDNFGTIEITDSNDISSDKMTILHLLYYLPEFNTKNMQSVQEFANSCQASYKPCISYLVSKFER